jgi:hypothetical protein
VSAVMKWKKGITSSAKYPKMKVTNFLKKNDESTTCDD